MHYYQLLEANPKLGRYLDSGHIDQKVIEERDINLERSCYEIDYCTLSSKF